MSPRGRCRVASMRGRAVAITWCVGRGAAAVAGGLALGPGERGSELAAVLQPPEGPPPPTGDGPDLAGACRPVAGRAVRDRIRRRAAGRWPCPPGPAAGWPRCAAAPWRSPGVWIGGRRRLLAAWSWGPVIEGVSSLQCCNSSRAPTTNR